MAITKAILNKRPKTAPFNPNKFLPRPRYLMTQYKNMTQYKGHFVLDHLR